MRRYVTHDRLSRWESGGYVELFVRLKFIRFIFQKEKGFFFKD
jgi:hypothetical protein